MPLTRLRPPAIVTWLLLAAALAAAVLVSLREGDPGPARLHVRSFGAEVDDGIDDGPAIQAAIDEAIRTAGSTVSFDPGTYDIVSTVAGDGPETFLRVGGADRLRLVGAGATLLFAEPRARGVSIVGSDDVTISDLTFDHAVAPFTQGVVVAVDPAGDTFDVAVADGFPGLDYAPFGNDTWNGWGTLHDPDTGLLKEGSRDHYPVSFDVAPVAAHTWRFTFTTDEVSDVEVGDGFVLPIRPPGRGAAVFVEGSSRTTIERVTIHSAAGAAVTAYQSDTTTVRDSTVAVRAGSGRWISVSADGVHNSFGRTGPVVERSFFSRLNDDALNVYQPAAQVRSIDADPASPTYRRRLDVAFAGAAAPGDHVQVFDPSAGVIRADAIVVDVSGPATDVQTITLDRQIDGVRPGPDAETADHLYNRSQTGVGFTFRDNVVEHARARGVVVRSEHGLIAGNTFRHLALAGIDVSNEPDFPEGPLPRHIVIERNMFDDVGNSARFAARPYASVVKVSTFRREFAPARDRGIVDVTVRDNRINGPLARHAVYIAGAIGVRIERTTIDLGDGSSPVASVVHVINANDVLVDGLEIVAPIADRPCVGHDAPGRPPPDVVVDDVRGCLLDS